MIVSEPARPKPNRGVLEWLEQVSIAELAVSVLTVGEIQRGISRMPAGKRKQALQEWLERGFAAQFEGRLLPIDADVAVKWGELMAEGDRIARPLPTIDGLLLATAAVHGMSIVTRNVGDFAERGVPLINPYS